MQDNFYKIFHYIFLDRQISMRTLGCDGLTQLTHGHRLYQGVASIVSSPRLNTLQRKVCNLTLETAKNIEIWENCQKMGKNMGSDMEVIRLPLSIIPVQK